ncbi:hypothetical protein CHS0354_025467 [Potamilus streckersoni]|uniref:Uncharacterized protein n=1 Tax=Potamilus streckersoni TaxID=2493646 RepID=A0AAE0VIQ9_9BIVA|nr:hypothetical protein CHS0354_025467 [Potamilus streckersoni]
MRENPPRLFKNKFPPALVISTGTDLVSMKSLEGIFALSGISRPFCSEESVAVFWLDNNGVDKTEFLVWAGME